jgi:hypothetical protein
MAATATHQSVSVGSPKNWWAGMKEKMSPAQPLSELFGSSRRRAASHALSALAAAGSASRMATGTIHASPRPPRHSAWALGSPVGIPLRLRSRRSRRKKTITARPGIGSASG